MAFIVRTDSLRGLLVASLFLFVLASTDAANSPAAAAAEVKITDARISGGNLVVTGTTSAPNTAVMLDDRFTATSDSAKAFTFNLIYLPPDCIVAVGKVGSTAAPRQAVVADCGPRGLNPLGTWDAATTYMANDVVTSLGSAWVATRRNTNRPPSSSPSFWEKYVAKGDTGPAGAPGEKGPKGVKGDTGATGPQGAKGDTGAAGAAGPPGTNGTNGTNGATGPQGPAGTVLAYADFFALMPGDNPATVATGAAVEFPQDGPTSGSDIIRTGANTFTLSSAGTYMVTFQVSTDEPGQLAVALNGVVVPATVVGRATGTSQIIGMTIVTASAADVLTVVNSSSFSALTITPSAGGTDPVSAHLTILRLH